MVHYASGIDDGALRRTRQAMDGMLQTSMESDVKRERILT
jgi:hypothetical protein